MPDDIGCLKLGAEEESGGILGFLIKEGVLPLKRRLHRCVHGGVNVPLAREQDVESGSCGLVSLGEHIVATGDDNMVHIGEFLFQVFRSFPVIGVIRLVIYVLRNHIGFLEVFDASVIVFVLGKDLVKSACGGKTLRVSDHHPVRV